MLMKSKVTTNGREVHIEHVQAPDMLLGKTHYENRDVYYYSRYVGSRLVTVFVAEAAILNGREFYHVQDAISYLNEIGLSRDEAIAYLKSLDVGTWSRTVGGFHVVYMDKSEIDSIDI